jgi:hypothetical protein
MAALNAKGKAMAKKTTFRRGRMPLFPDGATVSFKTDAKRKRAYLKAAFDRGVPASMWLREACDKKLVTESEGKTNHPQPVGGGG